MKGADRQFGVFVASVGTHATLEGPEGYHRLSGLSLSTPYAQGATRSSRPLPPWRERKTRPLRPAMDTHVHVAGPEKPLEGSRGSKDANPLR